MADEARHRRKRSRGVGLRRWTTGGVCAATVIVFAVAMIEPRDPGQTTATKTSQSAPVLADKVPPTSAQPSPSPNAENESETSIPRSGDGTFIVAPGESSTVGRTAPVEYSVEVENDLPFKIDELTRTVERTLADGRGWTKTGKYSFKRTDERPHLRILIATPATTDRLCAPLKTRGEVSCRNGQLVVINAKRWALGATSYGEDLTSYRRYVINHEVGHSLGLAHAPCAGKGETASVMLQQTIGLQGCRAYPWP